MFYTYILFNPEGHSFTLVLLPMCISESKSTIKMESSSLRIEGLGLFVWLLKRKPRLKPWLLKESWKTSTPNRD